MVVSLDRQWWLPLECGEPGGVIGVRILGPVTKLASFSGDVSDMTDVPPLLFALWCVGVVGGGVTVTWVLGLMCVELRCGW